MAEQDLNEAYASVRFMGPTLDPLDVTLALRLPYDHAHRDGEPRLGRSRKTGAVREYSPYRGGMWCLSSRAWVDSTKLDDHVLWLLEQLEERREAVAKLLAGGVHADIFCYSCGLDVRPPALPMSILERAGALGIKIDIDHYSSRDDEAI